MSNLFGFIVCTVLSIGTIVALLRAGLRDDDVFGDALVRVRAMRLARESGTELYAEIEVDNQNDSPVVVRARVRQASALSLLFVGQRARRTATSRPRTPADAELLGAVEGRGDRRFLLAAPADCGTLRVTTMVNQVGGRTRVITSTVRVSRVLDGVLPAVPSVVPRR